MSTVNMGCAAIKLPRLAAASMDSLMLAVERNQQQGYEVQDPTLFMVGADWCEENGQLRWAKLLRAAADLVKHYQAVRALQREDWEVRKAHSQWLCTEADSVFRQLQRLWYENSFEE
jgi:hypothetical protein